MANLKDATISTAVILPTLFLAVTAFTAGETIAANTVLYVAIIQYIVYGAYTTWYVGEPK